MGYGKHRVPRPLQDEDKWFKLTKRQWVVALPCILIIAGVLKLTYSLHLLPIGVAVSVTVLALGIVLIFVEMPQEKYLFGGGYKLDVLFMRLVRCRIFRKPKIYCKNLDNDILEWKRKL